MVLIFLLLNWVFDRPSLGTAAVWESALAYKDVI